LNQGAFGAVYTDFLVIDLHTIHKEPKVVFTEGAVGIAKLVVDDCCGNAPFFKVLCK